MGLLLPIIDQDNLQMNMSSLARAGRRPCAELARAHNKTLQFNLICHSISRPRHGRIKFGLAKLVSVVHSMLIAASETRMFISVFTLTYFQWPAIPTQLQLPASASSFNFKIQLFMVWRMPHRERELSQQYC